MKPQATPYYIVFINQSNKKHKQRMKNYIKVRVKQYFELKKQINLLKTSDLFDAEWYLNNYGDKFDHVKLSPEHHYLSLGYKLSFDPSAEFSTHLYLDKYPDVRESGINPLVHYLTHGFKENRKLFSTRSFAKHIGSLRPRVSLEQQEKLSALIHLFGAFQASWYSSTYFNSSLDEEECLAHFLKDGYRNGFDPTPAFSCARYCAKYPDILDSNVNPYVHYLENGRFEGRELENSKDYDSSDLESLLNSLELSEKLSNLNLVLKENEWFNEEWFADRYQLTHLSSNHLRKFYLIFGETLNIDPHPLFSTELNRKSFAKLLNGLVHPIELLIYGKIEQSQLQISKIASPDDIERTFTQFIPDNETVKKANAIEKSKWFNRTWYRDTYGLASLSPKNLALHFCTVGVIKEYDPCPSFSASYYLNLHSDVRNVESNALYHYITVGRREGREVSYSRYSKRMLGDENLLFEDSYAQECKRKTINILNADNKNCFSEPMGEARELDLNDYNKLLANYCETNIPFVSMYIRDLLLINSATVRLYFSEAMLGKNQKIGVNVYFISSDKSRVVSFRQSAFDCLYTDLDLPNQFGSMILEISVENKSYTLPVPYVSLLRGGVHFHELCFNYSLANYLEVVAHYGHLLHQQIVDVYTPCVTELLVSLENFDMNDVLFDKQYMQFVRSFGISYAYSKNKVFSETEEVIYQDLSIISESKNANKYKLNIKGLLGARLTIKGMISLALGRKVDENSFIYVSDEESSNTSFFSLSKSKEKNLLDINPVFIVGPSQFSNSLCQNVAPTLEVFNEHHQNISNLAVIFFIDDSTSIENLKEILAELNFDYHLYLMIVDSNNKLLISAFSGLKARISLINCNQDDLENLQGTLQKVEEEVSLIIVDEISPIPRTCLHYMISFMQENSRFVIPQENLIQKKGKDFISQHGHSAIIRDIRSHKHYFLSVCSDDDVIFVDAASTKVGFLNNRLLESSELAVLKYDKEERRMIYEAEKHKVELLPRVSVNIMSQTIQTNVNTSDQCQVRLN
ncbi:hypothetical protein ALT1644_50016 [Alteromonas macleodii]